MYLKIKRLYNQLIKLLLYIFFIRRINGMLNIRKTSLQYQFENNKKQSSTIKRSKSSNEERKSEYLEKSGSYITEIEPFLPLNNFLEEGNFQTSVRWKSSFEGGVAGGTGQQNPSFILDYGISDSSLITINFSEADDYLYLSLIHI